MLTMLMSILKTAKNLLRKILPQSLNLDISCRDERFFNLITEAY